MTPEQKRKRLELLQRQAQARAAQPSKSLGSVIFENVVGSGAVDTPGERLGEAIGGVANSFGRGVARGTAELVGLPGTLAQGVDGLVDTAANRLGLLSDDALPRPQNPLSGAALRGGLARLSNGVTEERGSNRAERIAGTGGEFTTPGAAAGGLRAFLGMAAAPGVASELAGEVTQGTALEPWARAIAGVGTSLATGSAPPSRLGGVGADDTTRGLAESLRGAGVKPTAGQVTGSNILRGMEGTVSPTGKQIEDFTAAAMRTIGSQAPKATREALGAAQKSITGAMDDVLKGVSFRPTQAMAQQAEDIATQYSKMAPAMALVPRARGIADEIIDAATDPNAPEIGLSNLREWRTALGRLTAANDEATRDAAVGLRRLIDEATDAALVQAGRQEDLATLAIEREKYRNFIAVRDAATRAGAETGTLSPAQLNSSVVRTQGREAVAVGRGTNLEELSRGGAAILRSAPTVEARGVRRLPTEMQFGGLGGLLGYAATQSPEGALYGAALGSAAVPGGQALMRSSPIQSILHDPGHALLSAAARTAPAVVAGSR